MNLVQKELRAMPGTPTPVYSRWRHGGWYVDNVRYPSGACGCVSRNDHDRKWLIVSDPRPFEDRPTFKTREEAAIAEWHLANAQCLEKDADARSS